MVVRRPGAGGACRSSSARWYRFLWPSGSCQETSIVIGNAADNARCSVPSGVAHLSRAMRPHSCTRVARRHVGRFSAITSSALDETQKMLALKRWGKAHDVGRAAVFLASDRADYITGQQLNVSGGYGLWRV
ncbi:SDR family oxidoreductase [Burkholderia sp. BKH01]|uniref:SDR family oxidoreductase n=1 Tax=Burkholderia sp. BKH01 TaxID=2769262 RepID=UPI0021DFFAF0|nr:SDR family oxidoreductase [Burkholderia sp. BKH01]MCU9956753.1 SDR family oxidoreductase [Burkholderia sp. BKH01]